MANNRLNDCVQSAIRAVADLDAAYSAARAGGRLSEAGIAEQVGSKRQRAIDTLAEMQSNVRRHADNATTDRAKLLALPALDPADVTGALADREIRERFLGLPENMQRQLQEAMQRGERRDVLTALARDPFDLPHSLVARALYADQLRRAKTAEFAALDLRDSQCEWAASALDGLARLMTQTKTAASASALP